MIIKRTHSVVSQENLSDSSGQIMDVGYQQKPVERVIKGYESGISRIFRLSEDNDLVIDRDKIGFPISGVFIRVSGDCALGLCNYILTDLGREEQWFYTSLIASAEGPDGLVGEFSADIKVDSIRLMTLDGSEESVTGIVTVWGNPR